MDTPKGIPALTYIFNSGVLTPGGAARDWNSLSQQEKDEMKAHAVTEMHALNIPVEGEAVPA